MSWIRDRNSLYSLELLSLLWVKILRDDLIPFNWEYTLKIYVFYLANQPHPAGDWLPSANCPPLDGNERATVHFDRQFKPSYDGKAKTSRNYYARWPA